MLRDHEEWLFFKDEFSLLASLGELDTRLDRYTL